MQHLSFLKKCLTIFDLFQGMFQFLGFCSKDIIHVVVLRKLDIFLIRHHTQVDCKLFYIKNMSRLFFLFESSLKLQKVRKNKSIINILFAILFSS